MKKGLVVFLTGLLLLFAGTSSAVETRLVVRARAKDAKFIGTSMGGALVVVRDAQTGEILAKGFTFGTTGNTKILMKAPHIRGKRLSDDKAAKFETTIDINEPTLVTIEVLAPYAQAQSAIKASTQIWLIPGKNIEGDGVIIEIPGFVVDVLKPRAHKIVKLKGDSLEIPIRANVTMMCGCPIKENFIWDANKYEVKAIVKRNGEKIEEIPLSFSGKTSIFQGTLKTSKKGVYEITVYAYDEVTGNTGVDKTTVVVK